MSRLVFKIMLFSLVCSGCFKTTYTRGPADPLTKENPKYHHILVSLVELSEPIAIQKLCPDGVNRVDLRTNVLTELIRQLTLGVYSPQQTFVQCKSGAAYNLEVDESDTVVAISQVAWVKQ